MMIELSIDAGYKNVTIGKNIHPIKLGEVINPTEEYAIRTYTFLGEKGEKADGCLFEIIPHGSTTVMQVIDETAESQEIAVKGRGWFLGINPEGEMTVQEVGDNIVENPLIGQRKGWVGVWIAGSTGMEVLDITEPPFNPSMEISVKRDDQAIPSKFWEIFDNLKTPTKT